MAVIKDINALKPVAQKACKAFLERCEAKGLKVRITETYRPQSRQNELYQIGRTKPGKKVTWTRNSRHTSRRAWDICQNIRGKEYSDLSFFAKCGVVAKELGITWGGTWKTPDRPHFEVKDSWKMPMGKEDIDMDKLKDLELQINKLNADIKHLILKTPKVYHYTIDVPDWGRPTIQKLLDKGIFKGASDDDLNLSEDVLKVLVINDRCGIYDK